MLYKSDGLNDRKDASCALHFSFLLQCLYFFLLFSCFAFEVGKCPSHEFSITVFVVIFPMFPFIGGQRVEMQAVTEKDHCKDAVIGPAYFESAH